MTPDREEIEKRVEAIKASAADAAAALPGAHDLVRGLAAALGGGRIGITDPSSNPLAGVREEMTLFTGFLSDPITKGSTTWRLLFTDEAANNYLVIDAGDILLSKRQAQDGAPFGQIDYIWVRADAKIGQGDTTQSLDGLLTVGGFTRASDFRGSFSATADAGMSGLGPLCTARTPCCCPRKSA